MAEKFGYFSSGFFLRPAETVGARVNAKMSRPC